MERRSKLFLIFFVIVLLLSIFAIDFLSVKKVDEVYMDLEIANSYRDIGFNPEGDALHFGKVPLTGTSRREFSISHSYSEPLNVKITIKGNITPFVTVSDNNFELNPNEIKELNASIKIPEDALAGNYNGTLNIIFKKPLIF